MAKKAPNFRQPTKIISIKKKGKTITTTASSGIAIKTKSIQRTVVDHTQKWATPRNLGGKRIKDWEYVGQKSCKTPKNKKVMTCKYVFNIKSYKK